jgi:AcrR family transcriptional regulator
MRRRLDLRAAAAVLADGEVTMNDVAGRLGVAKPTLYKLAGSRAELLDTCVEAETERLLGHLHGAVGLAEVVRAVDAYERDSPGGFRLLQTRELRRVEARLGGDVRAAALLGAALAAVSCAREQGCAVELDAM